MSYKDSGVDIDAGSAFVKAIKPVARTTFTPDVLAGIGGFGALFRLKLSKFKDPVLVAGTDGVGTKLKIAFLMNKHDTIGIDLVAMCVNDIVVAGAKPLFFLDYIATGKLDVRNAAEVFKGIAEGCKEAGCALIGGETAEMPSFYSEGEYDIAGFAVGIVEKRKIIDGSDIKTGDRLIGLSSSGLHSNGFSLVRKIFIDSKRYGLIDRISGLRKGLGEELLTPTRIYVKTVRNIIKRFRVKGIAHITGGGITENLPRILPAGCRAVIKKGSWKVHPIFRHIQDTGGISDEEMFRVFNMGVGMILVVSESDVRNLIRSLKRMGEEAYAIGHIERGKRGVVYD
ncbi:MAG: phosphoribosylformylglycinamidine cyclo-ligase [Nitrospirota bacterium]